jgi:hypothetical protein
MIKVKRQTVDESASRKLLTGMIVSTAFMEEAISFYNPDLLDVPFVRTVAEWCADYFNRYGKAPNIHIKDIFTSHADKMEPTQRTLISDLLEGLSNEYERADVLNVPYLLDQAESFFKERSLSNLFREGNGLLSQGETEEAERLLGSYKRVGRPSSLGANPFTDVEATARAFEREAKPLFTFPGALGQMLNDELKRERFIGILGADKSGKSFWLNEFAIWGAKARNNVAVFQIGDMTEDQVRVRLGVRLCNRNNRAKYSGEHDSPILDCLLNQQGKCALGKPSRPLSTEVTEAKQIHGLFLSGERHKACCECAKEQSFTGSVWYERFPEVKPISWRDAWKAGNRLLGRIKGRDFRLSCHASETLSVTGIKAILDNWETFDNFIPDVIVIDYADNLKAEEGREEYRHQVNRTWKMLRGLSQERHCLVITATQADTDSYDKTLLSRRNFSENKLKNAHVTAMVGLNQGLDEKRVRLMRLNMLVQREDEFYADDVVNVALDLWRGRPLLFSF